MTLLSKLRPMLKSYTVVQQSGIRRQMSDHRTFPITPSRWQWNKFKDHAHYYFMLGLIPCSLFVGYLNLFEGPATLSEIPEGYTPKYWEYYRNPVTRFLAKYVFGNPQEDYEKYLNYLFIEDEKRKLRELESKVKQKIAERDDYQAYYFRPVAAKYSRIVREAYEDIKDNSPEY